MNPIIRYYDTLASAYDEKRFNNAYGAFIDHQERDILERLIPAVSKTRLDLACGTGRLSGYAHIGVDASPKMIKEARTKHADKCFYIADAASLPFPDQSFETIIAFHFFMHLDQEKVERIVAECHRVLKHGGRLIFDIPSRKRREWLGYRARSWHGALSFSQDDLMALSSRGFSLLSLHGLLFLPIHRLPKCVRRYFLKLDRWLAASRLREFSSYLVAVFEKP